MKKMPRYHLNKNDEFIIENYNYAKPFANFFPGIAGKYGIPIWVFYVNRGQAIASFGTRDKDHAILEFQPANKSWYQVFHLGFRTFLKVSAKNDFIFYEPFHNGCVNARFDLHNTMSIGSSELAIQEHNATLGLTVRIEYFTVPSDSFAALARTVTITNTSKTAKSLQLLDGLPQLVPYGVSNLFLKKLSRTIEAWMDVQNLDRGVPFYKLDVDPTDRPQVLHIKKGNFYLGFHHPKNKAEIIRPIVDPQCIFGEAGDLSYPREFLAKKAFAYPRSQAACNKTPCGFLLLDLKVAPGESKSYYSLVGNMRSLDSLNASLGRIASREYLAQKRKENKLLIDDLQSRIHTHSSDRRYDLYLKQTFLDNVMRGGLPISFRSPSSSSFTSFYLYSRKHGDLERDYNKFQLQATYFSQGNGNYRDVNQNRRNDVWFNPMIHDENIIGFFNLQQADGFNPLVVKGETFVVHDKLLCEAALKKVAQEKDRARLFEFLSRPFTPGELIFFIEENKIKTTVSYDELLAELMPLGVKYQEADHGEGFWTDHWSYCLDLLERFSALYPEEAAPLMFEKKVFTFYDNAYVVNPRHCKYTRIDGLIRQTHAVVLDAEKKNMIAKRASQPHVLRGAYGTGEIYRTTLINKLLCVLANKFASFDPFGIGIEMEADKPNWFDSLNGLPALFGSSACETFELKRLVRLLQGALENAPQAIMVSEEIAQFLRGLGALVNEYLKSGDADKDFTFWDRSASLKEEYRAKTRLGLSARESEFGAEELRVFLKDCLVKIDHALDKARVRQDHAYYSYFFHTVTEYEPLESPFIKPLKFSRTVLPLFLEGQVHALRLCGDAASAKSLHRATKAGPLFDKKLKMYKVTAPLRSMPEEIGRCRVFTPGWLENESIWLHMEYKYLLELLTQGLHDEFYEEFRNILIPFQKPQSYGRSILENSSFIVSSAFPEARLHGNGFVARLSGSTAEMIHLWLLMNTGTKPFFLNEGNELTLRLRPLLAGWLFDAKGVYRFTFLGTIAVTFYNPKKKNTFGKNGVAPASIVIHEDNGKRREFAGDTLPSPYARQVRDGLISAIEVHFV